MPVIETLATEILTHHTN